MTRRTNLLRTSTVAMFAGLTAATVLPPHAAATEPDRAAPVGMIAIGHSGLTGENSDPERPGQPAPANSWATGTNPDVASVYLRLLAAQPQNEGHVANAAVGGALASRLVDQARKALAAVPEPALVIIQTIDNDIRCDGTDAEHIADFGDSVSAALDEITTESPDSLILIVGQFGRPEPSFFEALVTAVPSMKANLTGPAPCGFYDDDGNILHENFEALTSIIEGYEAEQQRRCDAVAQCRTDEGARARYLDKLENFSDDWAHLNIAGQAAMAEIAWPIVVDLLELDDPPTEFYDAALAIEVVPEPEIAFDDTAVVAATDTYDAFVDGELY